MSHGRTQIRVALAAALTGLTTTGSRVFVNRIHPVTDAELPCLVISTDSEQVQHATVRAPRAQDRQITATVRVLARATASLDTTLDTSLSEIETAILANRTLGGLARDSRIDRIEVNLDDGAEKPTGQGTVSILIDWVAAEGSPDTPL